MRTPRRLALFALTLLTTTPAAVWAQPFGTFRWRTAPHCNIVTLTATPHGDVLALDGFDEACDAGPRLPIHGVGIPHLDGTITLGLSVLRIPGGAPANLHATISASSGSGTWHDSDGNTGNLAFAPASSLGSTRPLPNPVQPPGPAGPLGPQGPQGSQGAQGPPGQPGVQGVTGPAGVVTAWGRVEAWHIPILIPAKSDNVADVTALAQDQWCVTFSEPIPLERRMMAMVGRGDAPPTILNSTDASSESICPGGLYVTGASEFMFIVQ